MDTQKQQVAQQVKEANNILVTVSSNPSVDQLAACIGLTLALNKMGKHATAVFSGDVPSTIEFLQPEKTLEKNTDSLRDFIIALDKSKADKLRYKVEDRVVKIFITPYKTSISDKDLEFSQGDFNVDVVLALGVHNQAELDQAITAHGRILHDATVVTMNVKPGGELGGMNWLDPGASSLSELAVQLLDMLDKKLMDGQIATSMLTGIVAETERFSNAKTSPQTMSISAALMGLGANQQLVATKLEEPALPPPPPPGPIAHQDAHEGEGKEVPPEAKKPDDGTLEISHNDKAVKRGAKEDEVQPYAPEGAGSAAEPEAGVTPKETPAEAARQEPLTLIHDVKSDHNGILPPPDDHHDRHDEAQDDEAQEPSEEKSRTEAGQPAQPEPAAQGPEPVLPTPETSIPEPQPAPAPPQIRIDEHGALSPLAPQAAEPDAADEALLPPAKPQEPPAISHHNEAPKMVLQPPTLGGQLSADAQTGTFGASGDDEDKAAGSPGRPEYDMPMLGSGQGLPGSAGTADATNADAPTSLAPLMPAAPAANDEMSGNAPGTGFLGDQPLEELAPPANPPALPDSHETLSDIERDVHSSHVAVADADSFDPGPGPDPSARNAPAAPQIPVVRPDDLTSDEVASAFAVPDAASNGVSDARDAVSQAFGGDTATTPPLEAIQSGGNAGDLLATQAAPQVTPGAESVAGPEPAGLPQTPPPVQPWMPPAEPELTTVPNPATQFDPAAFSHDDNPAATPPPGPPPMAPPHMPGT